MKKSNLIAALGIAVALLACNEKSVEQEDLTANVNFNLLVDENQELESGELKSAVLDRDALGDDFIAVAISKLGIKAISIGGGISYKEYEVKDGTGDTEISMDHLPLGQTTFKVTTESYLEDWYNDPQGHECDGFSSGTSQDIDWNVMFPEVCFLNPVSSKNIAEALRSLRPFVQFEGETTEVIEFCETDEDCNEINIDMKAKQGRMIATVEFENASVAANYYAVCTYTHNADGSSAPSRTTYLKYGSFPIEAWFYLTNENVKEKVECALKIEVYDNDDNLVRTHTIDKENHKDKMIVKNGVDRWLKVVITQDNLTESCNNFHLTWEWEKVDDEVEM